MRKIIIICLSIILTSLLIYSCRKNDIKGDSSNLILGSYITLDSTINSNLDVANDASVVSIKVAKTVGVPVTSVNVYAATGATEDTTKWVLIKNVPYSDGVVLSATTADLAKAFGATPLAPGNIYTLQNEVVTKDGRKFSVANTPDTYNSFPGYNMALTWTATAVCAFVQSETVGAYKVVNDAKWHDYNTGDAITVLAGPGPNQINALIYPSVIIGGGTQQVNTIIDVDPATGAATVAKQQTGYYGPVDPGNLATVSGSGFVFSCTGFISLTFTINIGGTDYKNYPFSMQRQ